MRDPNPYQSPQDTPAKANPDLPLSTRSHWPSIGFFIAAAYPFCSGVYAWHQFGVYAASLGPGEAACGMPVLATFFQIVIVAPIAGIFGACVASIAAVLRMPRINS